ncbi:MAG: SusC/RagA family TonB-linked outer membrane protein [Candidatus Pedobacter colombiensis]|uniref:SusC/RagA family TonB-linked outer membrane protein n=1 Tax=Candidatus Pedobacter colombiensis TaxID=3121371 RepID=A0AAJ5W8Z6_9SPHI|nr:SusC/RagA family TonB-linked outer membrane protein [Pedobacter sp.]WEK18612.1 MAG: SusC/RagA family TonB-linked outer membrane protein [Pedobacter sp.]
MRLKRGAIVFILTLLGIVVHAQKLNYVRKNVSLLQFFKEIRKQTGASVVWNEKEFNTNQQIDANFKNVELKKVMDQVSAKLRFTYTMVDKMIVVKDQPVVTAPVKTVEPKVNDKPVVTVEEKEVDLPGVEIVSTGYQRIPKERATGSFALVDSAQLNRRVSNDIFSRLEGITSGLLFNKNTLSSNSGNLDLSIRGRSTIYANDQPLIILDNFPFNGDYNSINPNDVASVTVLKDAASASIWGVRAGNGVIVITTKRGKYKQPLKLSFNTNLTVSSKPDVFYNQNYLSSKDFIDVETFLFNNGKYDAALLDKINYPVVSPVVQILDKQRKGQSATVTEQQLNALRGNDIRNEELKYFYRSPVSHQYFIDLSKGTDRSNHYLSAGYDRALSSLVNNENNRVTVNTQHTVKLLKNLELNAGLYYVRTNAKMDSTIAVIAQNFTPYYQFRDAKGNVMPFYSQYSAEFNAQALSKGFLDWSYVPLDELGLPPTTVIADDLRLNGGLNYTLFPGLKAETKYLYQRIKNSSELVAGLESSSTRSLINQYSILDAGQVIGYNIPLGAIQYQIVRKAIAKNFRAQLNYQKDWQKQSVYVITGYELSEFDTQLNSYSNYGYDKHTGSSVSVDTLSIFNLNPSGSGKISTGRDLFGRLDRIRSVFANAAYTYDQKYIISASARMDGSNYFGVKTNQKNIPLWSAGALWHLDRESFYKINWLPILKLRASYGFNGNLDKNYTGITTFRNIGNAVGTNLPIATIVNIGNPELRWEKIGIVNLGFDFGFKDNVVLGKVDYFFKKGTDILGDKAFPASSGIKVLRGNYSEMKAKGIDISLTSQNLKGIVKWQTDVLFSTVHDWITLYDVIRTNASTYLDNYNVKPIVGKPVYGIYSYRSAGLDPSNGDPRGYLNGQVSKDYSRIFAETPLSELEYNGPARPTLFGALNNTISFCKFTLAFSISYKLGYYFRKPTVSYYSMYHLAINRGSNNDFERRWQKKGDELFTDVPSQANYTESNFRDLFYTSSPSTVGKGDHVRLQDASLSFDLDHSNWRTIPMKQLRLYLYANNIGIIWKANHFGLDPDFVPGIGDRLATSMPMSFSIGIKASL